MVGEVDELAIVLQRNEIVALAGAQIDAVNVGAVRHGIGLAKAFLERLAERDRRDLRPGQRVAHLEAWRHPGIGKHVRLEADALDGVKDVRAELDAGAQFLEFRRLLENTDRKALGRQRISGDKTANAAAGDEKRQLLPIRVGHFRLLNSCDCRAPGRDTAIGDLAARRDLCGADDPGN